MKLEPPLTNLINRCQTICVAECCGIDAYDFSPIQIASYLTMWEVLPKENEVNNILNQLAILERGYGDENSNSSNVTIEQMNQTFTAREVAQLVRETTENITVALDLIRQSEALRARH